MATSASVHFVEADLSMEGHQAIARYDPADRNGLRSAGAAHMAHAVSFRSAST